jgi:DNA-binding transcriptional LysR family regulator
VNWDDLRYLLAVHRKGTLAGAAKELKVTKATASRRLAALEASVGTRLFDRKPDGLVLTPAGLAVLEAAQGMEHAAASVEDRLASAAEGEPRGTVRLTAPPWLAELLLIPTLPDLKVRFPDLEVDLVGTNQFLNLAQREADIALRNVRPEHQSLVARKVAVIGYSVYASPDYLRARGMPPSMDAIEGHDVLAYEGLAGPFGFEWLREPSRGGRITFRANDAKALLSAAAAGLGLVAAPCILGDVEASVVRVPTLGFVRGDVFLVTQAQVSRTPRVRAVGDFVAEVFARYRRQIEG